MKFSLLILPLALLMSCSGNAQKVEVGSVVPAFSLADQNGNQFNINSVIGKQKLVIYFYPADDTPGCTKEACSFRDQFDVFKEAGAMIIGISGQSVESHKAFADKYKLNFTLLADDNNTVRKLFGVPGSLIPGRVTYIVDLTGKVVFIFNSQSEPLKHVEEALRILKDMK